MNVAHRLMPIILPYQRSGWRLKSGHSPKRGSHVRNRPWLCRFFRPAAAGLFRFDRRSLRPTDVAIDILHCGVCHSDLHNARNDWGNAVYPMVPGHEIIGRVAEVGAAVTRFKPGDAVGVGCMVDSCRACAACAKGLE